MPARPALVMERDEVTFGELWERIDRAAAGLRSVGLASGDRAVVMIPMSIDLYVAMLAVLKIGAVAVFVDPRTGKRQIAAFAAFAEPRAWLGVPRSHLLRYLGRGLRAIPFTVTTGRRLGPLPSRLTLEELAETPGDGEIYPVERDAPGLITFTGGSSGEPKGANRTHRFLLAQRAALAEEFPAEEGDVDMPMFPVFALNNLAAGVPSVVPAMDFRRVEKVDAARVLAQMRRHGVTTCTASPPFFDRLAAQVALHPGEQPSLRRLLTGGAPVSDAQLRTWRRVFPETGILVVYGSTEAEPVAHLTAEERLEAVNADRPRAPGFCAGSPVARLRAKVVRIHPGPIELGEAGWRDWELPAGEIGELVVAGEHVCRDYYRNPAAVRENKIQDGDDVWHRLGDTGSFDGEGRFWLAGRVHSTIRRAGELVHPQLVEQAACGEDPRIRRAAAVGLADPALGERVAVVVESEEEGVGEEVAARVAAAGLPLDEVVVTAEPLPVDPRHNSKIDYGRLRARLGPPGPSFLRRLYAYLAERFPPLRYGVLIAAYYSSNQFLARTLTAPGQPMRYDLTTVMGALALLAFFFHLRVFDEHKDYAEDLVHYPHRVLQSGLVTLRHLKVLGELAIAAEAVLSALRGREAFVAWLAAFLFSLLMLAEFFARDWLKRRFLIYATSHLLVMPLLALMVFSFATGRRPWEAPLWFGVYAWVGFFVTFNWEVSRKIRAPEDEIAGVDTYTRLFGTYGAAYVVLLLRGIDTGLVALVGWHLGLSPWFYAALVALFLVCLIGFFQYRFQASRETAKRMETYAGLYVIAFDLILAVEIARRYGLRL